MDKKLKQRLLGAAVLVALAVIIVPELVRQPGNPVVDHPEDFQAGEETLASEPAPLPDYDRPEPLPAPVTESRTPLPPPSALPLPSMEEALEESQSPSGSTGTDDVAMLPERETKSEQVALPKPPPAGSASVEPWVVTEVVPEPEPDPQPEWQPVPEPRVEPKPSSPPRSDPPPRESGSAAPKAKTPAIELPPLTLISKASTQVPSPQASSSDPAASTGGQRWMVQAGSFSQLQNADNLKDRLLNRGFDAKLERARVNERVLYRVRVGPQGSRTESQNVRERLARDMAIQGTIVLLRR